MFLRAENLHNHYNATTGVLDLSRQDLIDSDVRKLVIPFLTNHPEIKKINLSHNHIGNDGAEVLASISTLTAINLSNNLVRGNGAVALASIPSLIDLNLTNNDIGTLGHAALQERNPVKRANYRRDLANDRRDLGITPEVPSLKRISLFKVQQNPGLDRSRLPIDLHDDLHKPRV